MRLRATLMQAATRTELDVRRVVVDVAADGEILSVEPAPAEPGAERAGHVDDAGSVDDAGPVDVDLGEDVVLLPGLVDAHLHAPQWPQLGTGLDLPLEEWLFEYTFPLERRSTDPAFADEVWSAMVPTLLSHGTTSVAYFGTISVDTTTSLAATCASLGQRALVGRVAMDHPEGTPDWYRDADAATSVDASRRSIEDIRALGSPLVAPIVTPRFTPACTDEALGGLARLALDHGVTIQTHCSESDWQHGYAFDRFGTSDTEALNTFGLLREHTVLAHGDHLGDGDLAMIAAVGAGVAHCPLSNAYFANAVFPARRALDAGVRVGLGSDVAGGSRAGMLGQAADAVTVSRLLDDGVDARLAARERGVPGSRISAVEAFWMATRGGADLLGLPVGTIEPGRRFDALAVDVSGLVGSGSGLRRWADLDDDARVFEKIVRLAGPAEILHVWVDGIRRSGTG
ncbi:MAG: amidohydrolase family protein [Actinomycetota bacterium]